MASCVSVLLCVCVCVRTRVLTHSLLYDISTHTLTLSQTACFRLPACSPPPPSVRREFFSTSEREREREINSFYFFLQPSDPSLYDRKKVVCGAGAHGTTTSNASTPVYHCA